MLSKRKTFAAIIALLSIISISSIIALYFNYKKSNLFNSAQTVFMYIAAILIVAIVVFNILSFWYFSKPLSIISKALKGDLSGINLLKIKYGEFTQLSDIIEQSHIHKKELVEAHQKAEESDRLKSAFLSNISHEVRTPLNGIVGFAQILRDSSMSKMEMDQCISLINDSSNNLLNIMNNIIEISKIESNQIEYNETAFSLNALFAELNETFQNRIILLGRNISIHFKSLPSDFECNIRSDKQKIRQILYNLIDNAVKFTENGSIWVKFRIVDEVIQFSVKDTGIGIPQGKESNLFKRFRQLDDATNRRYSGLGLGLCISKSYLDLVQGKIWFESREMLGTCFYFTIPYKPVKEFVKPESTSNYFNLRGISVMLIEDDLITASLYSTYLKNSGIQLIHFTHPVYALKYLNKNDIDVVVMDFILPQISGLDLIKSLRENRSSLPIIVQTAYLNEIEKKLCFDNGCDEFITKPVSKVTLFSAILSALNKRFDIQKNKPFSEEIKID
jgi:signal transduction histidine kinase/ActR/RegA family two-component response regulator